MTTSASYRAPRSPQRIRAKYGHDRARGFTLVELMITVVIIGIIAGIALPAYQGYTADARRAAAVALLADVASRQEQSFLNERTYTTDMTKLGLTAPVTTDGDHYTITVTAASATTYTLRATPTSPTTDSCGGNLELDNDGTKTPAACFSK